MPFPHKILYFAFTYDGSNIIIYIDGTAALTTAATGAIQETSAYDLHLGNDGGGNKFKGSLDEVKIWNRALTSAEITSTMSSENSGGEANLVAYYKFNQGTAGADNSSITTLRDVTAYHNEEHYQALP